MLKEKKTGFVVDHRENLTRALLFVVITFTCSYLLAFVYFKLGGRLGTIAAYPVLISYMFIPMIAAMVLTKFVYGEKIKGLGISWQLNRWFGVAWLLPAVLSIATMGITLLFPGISFSNEMAGMIDRFGDLLTPEQLEQMEEQIKSMPVHPFWLAVMQGLIAGVTVNAVAAFGEELGWRGYLQKYLGFMGFWKSSLLIGVIWGVWHAPLILQGHNYPQHPQLGVVMMTIWTVLLSPIFSYVRLKARSVIAAAVIHGSLNGTAGLAIMLTHGGDDLTTGLTGLPGFIVLITVNLLILFYDRYISKEKVNSLMGGL